MLLERKHGNKLLTDISSQEFANTLRIYGISMKMYEFSIWRSNLFLGMHISWIVAIVLGKFLVGTFGPNMQNLIESLRRISFLRNPIGCLYGEKFLPIQRTVYIVHCSNVLKGSICYVFWDNMQTHCLLKKIICNSRIFLIFNFDI